MTAPKAFLSHASEDKDRFVLDFAKRLRARGIDAWLDMWEMLPGDSLIDKIFAEGIKEAAAVIVVISKYSIAKAWVREELNAATVRHIENGTKLIPVVIDDCEVPDALRTKLWERVTNLADYDESLNRVVAAILGESLKPPVGTGPEYLREGFPPIPGLEHTDNYVLKRSCEHELESERGLLQPETVFGVDAEWEVPRAQVIESLKVLDHFGYLDVSAALGTPVSHYRITQLGWETYGQNYLENFEQLHKDVAAAIVNQDLKTNLDIAELVGAHRIWVDHVFDRFESEGLLQASKEMSRRRFVFNVSPLLRRWLEQ
jgi:hypothetical protein